MDGNGESYPFEFHYIVMIWCVIHVQKVTLGKKHEKWYPFSRNNGFVGKTLNETRLVLKGPFSTEP